MALSTCIAIVVECTKLVIDKGLLVSRDIIKTGLGQLLNLPAWSKAADVRFLCKLRFNMNFFYW